MYRIYAVTLSKVLSLTDGNMATTLARTKGQTPRKKGQRMNHLFDWMAHSSEP